jgi:Phage integrase, N-terminal SAM-like domain
VQDFLDRWLTVNLPGSVAEATEDSYVDTARLHLVPALGRKQLAKLTVADDSRGQYGSQRHPSLSSQMIFSPSPATPVMPWSSSRQYSPGS